MRGSSKLLPYDGLEVDVSVHSRGDGTNLTYMNHTYVICVGAKNESSVRGNTTNRNGYKLFVHPQPYGSCGVDRFRVIRE